MQPNQIAEQHKDIVAIKLHCAQLLAYCVSTTNAFRPDSWHNIHVYTIRQTYFLHTMDKLLWATMRLMVGVRVVIIALFDIPPSGHYGIVRPPPVVIMALFDPLQWSLWHCLTPYSGRCVGLTDGRWWGRWRCCYFTGAWRDRDRGPEQGVYVCVCACACVFIHFLTNPLPHTHTQLAGVGVARKPLPSENEKVGAATADLEDRLKKLHSS